MRVVSGIAASMLLLLFVVLRWSVGSCGFAPSCCRATWNRCCLPVWKDSSAGSMFQWVVVAVAHIAVVLADSSFQ